MTKTQLENFIDKTSLATVLTMLNEVCLSKADHIREVWQDESLAQVWENSANFIENTPVPYDQHLLFPIEE